MKRLLPLLLVVAALGCGDDDDPAGTGNPFEQTFTGTIGAGEWTSHTFTAPAAGSLQAVLTWPSAANDLDLYLTEASCTGYPPDDCTLLEISDDVTGSSETVDHTVTSGQQLKVWVDSWSDVASTYTIEVTID